MAWDTYNGELQSVEKLARHNLDLLLRVEESLIRYKSRDQAVNLGDNNTRYFNGLMKRRFASSYISRIMDSKGTELNDPKLIEEVTVSF